MLDLQDPIPLDIKARADEYINHDFDISMVQDPDNIVMEVYKTNYAGEVLLTVDEGNGVTIDGNTATVYVQEPDYKGYRGGAVWRLAAHNAFGIRTIYEGSFTIL